MYPDLPNHETIHAWKYQNPEFFAQYAKAKIAQADLLAEEIIDIADDTASDSIIDEHGNKVFNSEYVARSRLRIDTRKWHASKLMPKTYGDKTILSDTQMDSVIENMHCKLITEKV